MSAFSYNKTRESAEPPPCGGGGRALKVLLDFNYLLLLKLLLENSWIVELVSTTSVLPIFKNLTT